MNLPSLPDMLRFGSWNDPLWVEFDRRTGHSMNNYHNHMAYEIYYLIQGNRNYYIKDSVYDVHSGDIVLINSNTLHKTSELSGTTHERIVFHFSPSFFAGYRVEDTKLLLTPFAEDYPMAKLDLQERKFLERLLGSLLIELSERPPGYQLHIRNMSVELMLFTARHFLKHKAPSTVVPSKTRQKVTDIVSYIHSHYNEPLHLDVLASQFFISKGHFCRIFKQVTGFGFTEYLNMTRINEAENLLRDTDLSITLVSERCGFENFSHFGKVFKKLSGLSPRAYRKIQQSGNKKEK